MKNSADKEPYGNIQSTEQIGQLVRVRRKEQSVTQAELAALCGVGVRFVSNLENGKPTLELGKVLHVMTCLGLELVISPRNWANNLNRKSDA